MNELSDIAKNYTGTTLSDFICITQHVCVNFLVTSKQITSLVEVNQAIQAVLCVASFLSKFTYMKYFLNCTQRQD